VELVSRRDGSSENVPVADVAARIAATIRSERENLA
jgi:hypothetical protein